MALISPEVIISTSEGELNLTYHNTLMRLFKDTGLDHVEYRVEGEGLKGIRVVRAVLDTLFELEYPMKFDPYPDEQTMDWFINLEHRNLEIELGELG